jgi:hypothetical protein
MRFRHLILHLLVAVGLNAGPSPASGPADDKPALAFQFELGYATRHIERGVTQTHDAWQPALAVEYGAWTLGIWNNRPVDRNEDGEIETSLGYEWEPAPGFIWTVGAADKYNPDARDPLTLRRTAEFIVAAERDFFPNPRFALTGALEVTWETRVRALRVSGSLSHTQSLAMLGVPLDFTAGVFAGHSHAENLAPLSPSAPAGDSHQWRGARLEVLWQINERSTFRLLGEIDRAAQAAPTQGATGNTRLVATLGVDW